VERFLSSLVKPEIKNTAVSVVVVVVVEVVVVDVNFYYNSYFS